MRIEDIINRAWDKGMNAEAEDVIRLGWAVGVKVAKRRGWEHEIEDIKQDGALGALLAWRMNPSGRIQLIWVAARNYIYAQRSRLFRRDGRLGVGLSVVGDQWARCEAAMDVERLAVGLTEKMVAALTTEGKGRGDDAHYKSRSRAIGRMRCLALETI